MILEVFSNLNDSMISESCSWVSLSFGLSRGWVLATLGTQVRLLKCLSVCTVLQQKAGLTLSPAGAKAVVAQRPREEGLGLHRNCSPSFSPLTFYIWRTQMTFPPRTLCSPEHIRSHGQGLWGGGNLVCCSKTVFFFKKKKREMVRNLVNGK